MCTVSFLPTPAPQTPTLPASGGFILTSNRDEMASRQRALFPRRYNLNGRTVFYPKDGLAGGTWIATDEQQYTLCLLNGAFDAHRHQPPYRHSRGQVIPAFFSYENEVDFSLHYPFVGLEPFTLVVVAYASNLTLTELRWDGTTLHRQLLNAACPYLWSSATLYPYAIRQKRERWFVEWLQLQSAYSQEAIVRFHEQTGDGDPTNALLMQRPNGIRTVSITSVEHTEQAHRLYYRDLLTETATTFRILS
ncbi:NRDE family protein [Spirosoma montaniterrae]|uniref:NRDE family protein n=1 Tax=Spirosoma montaniterrae TaxID=1178516 RepID=A0A1P9WSF8_9BACT|nr:NRDE family protein [Spirosoma montaniterrae]AQG78299.1 hypothetical protein AWR27_02450 [Spirosoma montaniterrae]